MNDSSPNYYEYWIEVDKGFWDQVDEYRDPLELLFLESEDFEFLSSVGMKW